MSGDAKRWSSSCAEQLGELFRRTCLPVIVLRRDGRFACVNDAAIQLYGYSLDDFLAMKIHDLIGDERSVATVDVDLRRVFGGDLELSRRPHRRKDGGIVWVKPAAQLHQIDGEQVLVSVLTDVTGVVEAEQRLREAADERVRDRQLVLSAIADMIAEREVEPALAALARSLSAASGAPAAMWLPDAPDSSVVRLVASHGLDDATRERLSGVRIDWREGTVAGNACRAKSSVAVPCEELVIEPWPDGIDHLCVVAPLRGRVGTHGLLTSHGGAHTDEGRWLALASALGSFGGMILESVQLERRAEAVWKAASERLTDGIALLDRDLSILRTNSALATLLDVREDIVGRKCTEVFTTCIGRSPCPHEIALREGLHLVREMDGPHGPLRIEIIPSPPEDSAIGLVHAVHDLSEERTMQSRLLTADRLATIGRLSAGVAHEINNPAAFVTVNLGVLRDRFAAGKDRRDDVVSILDESLGGMARIRDIVRDLKGFARERGRDVHDLSHIAASALRIAAHETRGRARVERLFEENVLANVRGARLAQCVLNLVVNAAQAIPAGTPHEHVIQVRTYRLGDRARLEVTDTGPGVPDALKTRIFDAFFTTKETSGGTGLGLWLARKIVEEEGGSVTVEDAPRRGAKFVLDLPFAENPGTKAAGPP